MATAQSTSCSTHHSNPTVTTIPASHAQGGRRLGTRFDGQGDEIAQLVEDLLQPLW